MGISKLTPLMIRIYVGVALFCGASSSFALENSNVLLLYNSASSDGAQIASYYQQIHPGVVTLGLQGVPTSEVVSWDVYLDTIRPQVLSVLNDSIDCIVTSKGLPLRIDNPGSDAFWNRYSSLESELTRIDSINSRALMGNQGWILPDIFGGNSLARNPYAFQNASFDHQTYGTRLTARLDAFSVDEVIDAIDRAQRAVVDRPGFRFVLDDDPDAPASSVDRMEALDGNILEPRNLPRIYDGTDAFVAEAPGRVCGYVSHGIHGSAPAGYILDEQDGLRFELASGAVFHSWESYNAYSFEEGGNRDNQALLAEWIRKGGTAGTGHVEEPGVDWANTTNEDRMFEMLLDGYTWAEAAWNATYQLSYVNTVIGDPLMVFQAWMPGDTDLDGDVDMVDITAVKAAYGSQTGQQNYSLMADMNADGLVNFWDLTFVKYHYTGPGDVPPPGRIHTGADNYPAADWRSDYLGN